MQNCSNTSDGILLVDKEEGHTSFETVRKAQRILRVKKAGHAGTLDKAASGLLIVCLNKATSVQSILMNGFKLYRAEVRFGAETDTLDRYGRVVKTSAAGAFSDAEVRDVLHRFVGRILQVPPRYSAIHVRGRRSYLRSLDGEEFDLPPREVEIRELRLVKNQGETVTLEILSSKGTYVRALARDVAAALGTCGHLHSLRRLAIGPFSVNEALTTEELKGRGNAVSGMVIPLNKALASLAAVNVGREQALKINNGIPLDKIFEEGDLAGLGEGYTRVLFRNELLALVEKREKPYYFKVFKREDLECANT